MSKNSMATKIKKLLIEKPNMSPAAIARKVKCSADYVYLVKKRLRDAAPVAPPKVMRDPVTKILRVVRATPKDTKKAAAPKQPVSDVDAVLAERGNVYGDYRHVGETAFHICATIDKSLNRSRTPIEPYMSHALMMLATKLARIAHGDPYYRDSWVDIAGYATLVANQLKKDPY